MRVRTRIRLHRQIERDDRTSRALLLFAIARGCAWLLLIVCVVCGLLGVTWLKWAASIGGAITFITLISLYANAEGEFAQAAGMWAAIRAGRAHAQGVANEQSSQQGHAGLLRDIAEISARVETLAELIHDHQLRSDDP